MNETKDIGITDGKICCFTGHRRIKSSDLHQLSELADRTVERLIGCGFVEFRTGGALGFDTLAALTVLEKKEKYPQLRLHLCLPCRDQNKLWADWDRTAYNFILQNADEISYVCETYQKGCMHERNRRMVDGSQCCVAFCTSEKGGSSYTLRYASEQGLQIINLAGLMTSPQEEGV